MFSVFKTRVKFHIWHIWHWHDNSICFFHYFCLFFFLFYISRYPYKPTYKRKENEETRVDLVICQPLCTVYLRSWCVHPRHIIFNNVNKLSYMKILCYTIYVILAQKYHQRSTKYYMYTYSFSTVLSNRGNHVSELYISSERISTSCDRCVSICATYKQATTEYLRIGWASIRQSKYSLKSVSILPAACALTDVYTELASSSKSSWLLSRPVIDITNKLCACVREIFIIWRKFFSRSFVQLQLFLILAMTATAQLA